MASHAIEQEIVDMRSKARGTGELLGTPISRVIEPFTLGRFSRPAHGCVALHFLIVKTIAKICVIPKAVQL